MVGWGITFHDSNILNFCTRHGQICWQVPWVQKNAWKCFKAGDIGHRNEQDSWREKTHGYGPVFLFQGGCGGINRFSTGVM